MKYYYDFETENNDYRFTWKVYNDGQDMFIDDLLEIVDNDGLSVSENTLSTETVQLEAMRAMDLLQYQYENDRLDDY